MDDLSRPAEAGQPMPVQGEFGGVAGCPVCGATLVLTKEQDATLRVPEHDFCAAGGGRLVPVSGHPGSGYTLIGPVDLGNCSPDTGQL